MREIKEAMNRLKEGKAMGLEWESQKRKEEKK